MSVSVEPAAPLRLASPEIGQEALDLIEQAVSTGILTSGPLVAEFERQVRDYLGVRYAVATSSGTAALHLALLAGGLQPGDEVLVPDFTFPATANAVIHCGASPVLVDIDPVTLNIDPEDARAKVSKRTWGIIPVHLFGLPADMMAIGGVAVEFGFKVLEDAACALGATYRSQACGTFGYAGCFSFHPRKVITTAEGGMVATNDPAIADRVAQLRNHGMAGGGRPEFVLPGLNYRLSEIHAALGIAQMRVLDRLIERRRELAERYALRLREIPEIGAPAEAPGRKHIYQSYVVSVDPVRRDDLIRGLAEAGIEANFGTYALHRQPAYRDFVSGEGGFPESESMSRRSLALPLHPCLVLGDVDRVCDRLARLIRGDGA